MTATAIDEWPRLLSASEIAQLEADVEGRSDVLGKETSDLSKRVAALKEKAAAMNQPVLSEQERARLLQAASNGI